MNKTKLIVGLGNPGEKYQNTRHNTGELILNFWAKNNDLLSFKYDKKLKSFINKAFFNGQEIILALPQTFMNESGIAVSQIAKFYKILPENIWIIHDDLDLPLGKIKISKDKSSAGHKGAQSIIDHLKTKDFVRFRIGISNEFLEKQKKTKDFVLEKFTSKEKKILKEVIKKTSQMIEISLMEGFDKAMSRIG